MRIAAGVVGLILMIVGIIAVISSLSANPDSVLKTSWTCYSVTGSSPKQECNFDADSPQDVTRTSALATQGVIAGSGALVAGAALLGGAAAGSRSRSTRPAAFAAAGYPPPGFPPGGYSG